MIGDWIDRATPYVLWSSLAYLYSAQGAYGLTLWALFAVAWVGAVLSL